MRDIHKPPRSYLCSAGPHFEHNVNININDGNYAALLAPLAHSWYCFLIQFSISIICSVCEPIFFQFSWLLFHSYLLIVNNNKFIRKW